MTKRDSQDNSLLGYIYDLYDAVYNIKTGIDLPIVTKRFHPWLENVGWGDKDIHLIKTIKTYPKLDEVLKKIGNYVDRLSTEVPDFDRMWDFCEFVRISEKVFFYRNEIDNYVFVEMKMDKSDKERKLCIKDIPNDYEVRFTIEKFVYDSEMITINVVRDYGLQMNNVYKVVNGDLQFDDSSDRYLINQINFLLQSVIKTTFLSMVEQILKEGGLEDYARKKGSIN